MRAVAAFVSQHAQEMNGVVPKTYRDNSTINVMIKVTSPKALEIAKHYLSFLARTKCTFDTFKDGDLATAADRYQHCWARAVYRTTPQGIIVMEASPVSLYHPMEVARDNIQDLQSQYDAGNKARRYDCSPEVATHIISIFQSQHVIMAEISDDDSADANDATHEATAPIVPPFVDGA
mmetsp:Transcript_4250/g.12293  ORF Transcript_4250/g.12293 Transcript_4250/m.12293 type:complete len:178 (+) Transcript_4250:204-737(+)